MWSNGRKRRQEITDGGEKRRSKVHRDGAAFEEEEERENESESERKELEETHVYHFVKKLTLPKQGVCIPDRIPNPAFETYIQPTESIPSHDYMHPRE